MAGDRQEPDLQLLPGRARAKRLPWLEVQHPYERDRRNDRQDDSNER
jgi:hypothetical protein